MPRENRAGSTTSNERFNESLHRTLTDDGTFHYKDINTSTGIRSGFSENRFIPQVVQLAFFPNVRHGIGYKYSSMFNPIPVETVAFVLTVIHASIDEWSSGHQVSASFTEAAHAKFYRGIMDNLNKWAEANPSAWLNIHTKWYKRAFRTGGGVNPMQADVHISKAAMTAARAELGRRTGLTDSEDDGDDGAGSNADNNRDTAQDGE
ncbi:hypothetical protein BN946_scf184779.g4 [Trametes cinnabarina]|uniref:DUF6532 domain-containing protein n=1 Tax=Pycnoporus cinnabarinus TaxID=5643 RepID=A0A060S8V0_PYCCI|nr:hypothetical protein BN946_scf184779.g4 [Trametes cinnabarina]